MLIVTDHRGVDYAQVLREAKMVFDTRNATGKLRQGAKAKVFGL